MSLLLSFDDCSQQKSPEPDGSVSVSEEGKSDQSNQMQKIRFHGILSFVFICLCVCMMNRTVLKCIFRIKQFIKRTIFIFIEYIITKST